MMLAGSSAASPSFTHQPNGWDAGIAVVVCLALVAFVSLSLFLIWLRRSPAYGLTPGRVVSYKEVEERPVKPEILHQLIVERLKQIRRALRRSLSEVEVEMCALGYRSCAEDTLTLTRMIDEDLSNRGPVRRIQLKIIRHRSLALLSKVRKALPEDLPHRSPQELP